MERRKQILYWIKETLDKNLSGVHYNAFIFGSQANKAFLSRSDIDVGIMADEAITPYQFFRIVADMEELPMLYKIDLVDFNTVDSQFKLIALKNTEKL